MFFMGSLRSLVKLEAIIASTTSLLSECFNKSKLSNIVAQTVEAVMVYINQLH